MYNCTYPQAGTQFFLEPRVRVISDTVCELESKDFIYDLSRWLHLQKWALISLLTRPWDPSWSLGVDTWGFICWTSFILSHVNAFRGSCDGHVLRPWYRVCDVGFRCASKWKWLFLRILSRAIDRLQRRGWIKHPSSVGSHTIRGVRVCIICTCIRYTFSTTLARSAGTAFVRFGHCQLVAQISKTNHHKGASIEPDIHWPRVNWEKRFCCMKQLKVMPCSCWHTPASFTSRVCCFVLLMLLLFPESLSREISEDSETKQRPLYGFAGSGFFLRKRDALRSMFIALELLFRCWGKTKRYSVTEHPCPNDWKPYWSTRA